ncbi:MAG: dihydrofolate reductase [bacterium]|nr:dihydrofolate reductase [bacterium]
MLTLIAAIAKNGCIGINGKLPWHIPEDFEHFKRHTMGKVVLMGRKTWESLPLKYRPLPNRMNIVITRQDPEKIPGIFSGAEVHDSIDAALAAHANDDVYVIGGEQLYAQTIDSADRLIITHVDRAVDGDAFFPAINLQRWTEAAREPRDGFSFIVYECVRSNASTQVDNPHTAKVL